MLSFCDEPRCLICNRPLPGYQLEPLDHPEDIDRALLCAQHPAVPMKTALSEVFASRDDYIRRVEEISRLARGEYLARAWFTTRYFSLLVELSDNALLLFYPIMRRAALLYVPLTLRAGDAPGGLAVLDSSSMADVLGPCDIQKPKRGLADLLGAMNAKDRLSGIHFRALHGGEQDYDSLVVTFENGRTLQICAEGWEDLGYAREAIDLSLRWTAGHGPV